MNKYTKFCIRKKNKRDAYIKSKKKSSINVVSFFSGCGGLDLGVLGGFSYKNNFIKKLPFNIIAAYDNDEKCVNTYRQNIGKHIEMLDLAKADPHEMPSADLLIGGFPCQDFSSCGPHAGLSSKRGRLYKTLIKYMLVHKPKVVLAENVVNLARMGGGSVLKKIIGELSASGYRFEVWSVYAPDYGVPQSRTRLFIIGVRNNITGFPAKPTPTHSLAPRSIDWAIGDLVQVTDETIPNQSQYFKARKAKNGNGQGDEISRAGLPSYTIRANVKSRMQYHYTLKRRLTVRECARLQTFPDNFILPYSTTTNVRQIGNAVPPLLANHVARSIADFLLKKK